MENNLMDIKYIIRNLTIINIVFSWIHSIQNSVNDWSQNCQFIFKIIQNKLEKKNKCELKKLFC